MCYTSKIPDLSTPEKRDEWFYSEFIATYDPKKVIIQVDGEERARRAEEIDRKSDPLSRPDR